MVMSTQEIVVRYKQAKHKNQQVNILADLNDCTKQEIVDALIDGGINKVALTRIKGTNLNNTSSQESEKTQKAPEKTPEETQEMKEEVEKSGRESG